ncbi:MAG: VWA domain-containing protein, partial [Deltaproteobacteria bacterium]|nr:VWA domain-containing protein [Deltaproteobacteria bacterium]
LARWQMGYGLKPTTEVRPWEFLNYYTFDYEAPPDGHVNVLPEMRPVETSDGTMYEMQIGARAQNTTNEERRPLSLTFSIDTSGSMGGNPILRAVDVCLAIASYFKEGDVVSIVAWALEAPILLDSHPVVGPDDTVFVDTINSLTTGGETDLHEGLVTAYELAYDNFNSARINRVILMSDGNANAGITDLNLIAEAADDSEEEGIYLAGIGLGKNAYGFNEELMNEVTDAGKGAYVFIGDASEAERMFGEPDKFLSIIDVAARDVRMELTLPPGWWIEEFHGEEYSTDPVDVDPQHLAPNDAMIFHQVLDTCGDLTVSGEEEIYAEAQFYDPLSYAPSADGVTVTVDELLAGSDATLRKGNAIVHYALTIAETQELYDDEDNYPAIVVLIDASIAEVESALDALAGDPDLTEIAAILEAYRTQFI